jgi:hypothetical protein
MFLHLTTKKTITCGIDIPMNCPNCQARGVIARAADVTSREYVYGLVSVTTSYSTTITCGACQRSFRSPWNCDELATMNSEQVSEVVARYGMSYVGNITKFCILMSLIFGIVPVFGLGCATVGVIGTRNSRSRWRAAAFVGLAISTISTLMEVAFLLIET